LNIISLEDVVPTYATGEESDDAQLHEALPTVSLEDDTKAPTIETPEGTPPEDLTVDVLKQGDGPEVQAESYVTIHYRGISWSDGEEFDSSWTKIILSHPHNLNCNSSFPVCRKDSKDKRSAPKSLCRFHRSKPTANPKATNWQMKPSFLSLISCIL